VRYVESEACGFPRGFFPAELAGHEIHLLHNDAHETVDGRFQLHFTLHCPRCDDDYTIRGRVPPEFERYNYIAALVKLTALGYFKNECSGRPHHTYYGP